MAGGDFFKEVLATIARLGALEARTEDVARDGERLDEKLGGLLERLTRLESDVAHLRTGVRNEILGELQGKLAEAKVMFDLLDRGLLVAPEKPKKLGD